MVVDLRVEATQYVVTSNRLYREELTAECQLIAAAFALVGVTMQGQAGHPKQADLTTSDRVLQ